MNNLLTLAAAAVVLCSCGSRHQYTIQGTLEGTNGTVYLFGEKQTLLDSAIVEQGAFRIVGEAEVPAVATLSDARDRSHTFAATVILEPGVITVSDDAENSYRKRVNGTPANDALEAYTTASQALVTEYRSEETSEERRAAIEEEFDQLARTALEQNRTNFFGVLILVQQLGYELSGSELLKEIELFPAELQQTETLTKLRETAERKVKTDVGQPFTDIAQNNASGEEVTLGSVVKKEGNKYVLLDFWASWCGPCMGEVPHLKKTYDEFHKKGFEIYGVSFDSNREKWLGAIEQHGLNWVHVSALNGFDNQAAHDYAVQGIPANFLIDSNGTIVASNLRGEALYAKVAELLAE